ncbi:MAG TPA: cytochrome c biogenesis protein CcdA [Candidatus Ratteibacteria bacterium]|nr:cytochrome c biogenesis protein CcdA [Candidatus Ratteibacteria bacterium]
MEIKSYSLGISFVAGVLSFLSPCILPLIPIYISYITGISIEQLQESKNTLKIFIISLFFISGFTLIFVLMGASATAIGNFILKKKNILRIIGGIIIIIFGLHLIGILKIKKLYTEKKIVLKNKKTGYLSSFLLGMAFSAGWTPCVGPVLSSILIIAANEKTVLRGIILLFTYSIGIGIPFLITSLLLNKLLNFFNKIKKHYRAIEIIMGFLLVILGVLFLLNKFIF